MLHFCSLLGMTITVTALNTDVHVLAPFGLQALGAGAVNQYVGA